MKRPESRRSLTPNKIKVLAAVMQSPGLSTQKFAQMVDLSLIQTRLILFEWQGIGEIECRKGYYGKYLWYPIEKSD